MAKGNMTVSGGINNIARKKNKEIADGVKQFTPEGVFGNRLTISDKNDFRKMRKFIEKEGFALVNGRPSSNNDIYDINLKNVDVAMEKLAKPASVDVKNIYPVQTYLNKETVVDYMTNPQRKSAERGLGITGYRLPNGKVILDDGHHRVAAAILKGKKSVNVNVVDVVDSRLFKSLRKKK